MCSPIEAKGWLSNNKAACQQIPNTENLKEEWTDQLWVSLLFDGNWQKDECFHLFLQHFATSLPRIADNNQTQLKFWLQIYQNCSWDQLKNYNTLVQR